MPMAEGTGRLATWLSRNGDRSLPLSFSVSLTVFNACCAHENLFQLVFPDCRNLSPYGFHGPEL